MCINIVASALKYGWAPTFTPGDDDVDLATGLGELDQGRRSTRPIQSMFSVPEVIEIVAPEEGEPLEGNLHPRARSIAARIRRHSASASEPRLRLGSPSSTTRAMPSGCFGVTLRMTPTTRFAVFSPEGTLHRHQLASGPRRRGRAPGTHPAGTSILSVEGVSIRISS